MVQAAEHRRFCNTVTGRQLVSMVTGWNTRNSASLFAEEEVFCCQRAAGLSHCVSKPTNVDQDRNCRPKKVPQRGEKKE